MNYPSIRIEGAIFSPDILDRLEDAPAKPRKMNAKAVCFESGKKRRHPSVVITYQKTP